jgi:signal peptidase II
VSWSRDCRFPSWTAWWRSRSSGTAVWPSVWRWVVAVLSVAALLILVRVATRVLPTGGFVGQLSIGLIFGGAVGNLVDRARFGAVIDFVDVHLGPYHWPAFNVADSAITVGVALLALRLLARQPAPSKG